MSRKSSDSTTTETSTATTTSTLSARKKEESKYGAAMFLQLDEQPAYISVLIRNKYKLEFHTMSEWKEIVSSIKNTKIIN